MASPCIGFEIGLGHICWYFRAYICSKILKVLHPCIGFGIGLGHIWGHANAWIWYIHAYAWILYIHVLSHISHIPKAEIFGFMFQYLSSERMGLRFWANPIHNTWLDHGEISRTRCTPFCPVMITPGYSTGALRTISGKEVRKKIKSGYFLFWDTSFVNKQWKTQKNIEWVWQLAWDRRDYREARCQSPPQAVSAFKPPSVEKATALCSKRKSFKIAQLTRGFKDMWVLWTFRL